MSLERPPLDDPITRYEIQKQNEQELDLQPSASKSTCKSREPYENIHAKSLWLLPC
jgi:hypothetical protein